MDHTDVEDKPNFPVLRVSKILCHEAKEILYSDSVFRFVINFHYSRDEKEKHGELHRLKKVAPLMMNVVLDIDGLYIDTVERSYCNGPRYARILARNFHPTIDLFGGQEISRHSLHVRFLESSTALTLCSAWSRAAGQISLNSSSRRSNLFSAICKRLKPLVSFHVATVEVMLTQNLLESPEYYGFDDTEPSKSARKLVCRITQTITEHLEPAFGPAIFSFKSNARTMPLSKKNLLRLNDINLIGFLQFHPRKHLVKEPIAGSIQGDKE